MENIAFLFFPAFAAVLTSPWGLLLEASTSSLTDKIRSAAASPVDGEMKCPGRVLLSKAGLEIEFLAGLVGSWRKGAPSRGQGLCDLVLRGGFFKFRFPADSGKTRFNNDS